MKPIEDILKSDDRSTFLSYQKRMNDGSHGESKPLDLEYYYNLASDCSLPESVPKDVQEIWEVAQHLLVYTLYDHSFLEASNLYCSLALEAGLKDFCKVEVEVLMSEKLKSGKKQRELGFYDICRIFEKKISSQLTKEEAQFLHARLDAFRTIRNRMAHLEKHLALWVSYSHLPLVSGLLKGIFENSLKSFVEAWLKSSHEKAEELTQILREAQEEMP